MAGETLQWRLRLREDVFGPASRAQKALRAYQAESNRIARIQRQQQAAMARLNAQAFRRDQQMRRAQERAAASSAQRMARLNAQAFRRDQAMQRARDRALTLTNTRAARASGGGAWRGLAALGGGLAGGLAFFGGLASSLADLVGTFGSFGLAAGQAVVEVAAFRESTLAALSTVTGSSEQAGRMFRNAMVIANQTPLDTPDVIRMLQRFSVAGFNERESNVLTAAGADISAAFGRERADSFALVASQLRASGRANRGDLTQLLNAGVNTGGVLDSVARQLGITNNNEQARRNAVLSRLSSGGVSGNVLLQGALDSIRQRLDQGGALGGFARRQSETLTGALSNLRNAGFNLLASIDFAKIPGVRAFRDAILQITAALDAGSPAGKRLRSVIEGAVNTVGGLFARINPQTIAGGLGAVQRVVMGVWRGLRAALPVGRAFVQGFGGAFVNAVRPLGQFFAALASGGGPSAATMQSLATSARGLGQSIGYVLGTMVTLAGYVATFVGAVGAAVAYLDGLAVSLSTRLYNAFGGVGGDIVRGLINGIGRSAVQLASPVTGMAMSAVDAAKAALGIASPSKVFADEVGRWIPAGVEQGITRNTSGMTDALTSTVQPPAVPRLGGLGGVTIYVTVTEARDARATATAVTDDLELQLGAIFGRLAETA